MFYFFHNFELKWLFSAWLIFLEQNILLYLATKTKVFEEEHYLSLHIDNCIYSSKVKDNFERKFLMKTYLFTINRTFSLITHEHLILETYSKLHWTQHTEIWKMSPKIIKFGQYFTFSSIWACIFCFRLTHILWAKYLKMGKK